MPASPTQASKTTLRRGTFNRGTIACPRCGSPIHVHKVEHIGDEFSARCKSCGHRGFFSKRALTVDQYIDRRAKPRV